MGQRLQYALPRVQALGPRGRDLDAPRRALAAADPARRPVRARARPFDRHHGHLRGRRARRLSNGAGGQGHPAHGGAQPRARPRR